MIQKRTTEPSKNSVHAPWIHAAGILTALWLMIVFLITAVEAVAYWHPGYYKMEYEKYQVHGRPAGNDHGRPFIRHR